MLVRRKWRWREEGFLKYASENYGIDKICDYAAIIEVNIKITDDPARKAANAAIRDASQDHTHALFARTTGSRCGRGRAVRCGVHGIWHRSFSLPWDTASCLCR